MKEEIREGQTWIRYSKRHYWKVRITHVNDKTLYYDVIEYDGSPVKGDNIMDVKDSFMERFELET